MTLADIYREHLDYVWQSLRRLGVPAADLEDVAHEVFVVVHRRLADYDRARPIRPWLFGIAYRVASEYRRRAVRREQPGSAEVIATDTSPEMRAVKNQAIALAKRALAQLDDDARAVFILAELDGVPVTDVATTLEIPVNTAYTRLRRARLAVAEALTRSPSA